MIRNGIDLRPFDCASAIVRHELGWDAYPIVRFVGRLSGEKGVDIFLMPRSVYSLNVRMQSFS